MMKDDDFKLLRGFADKRTDKQTFVIVELLSRLKIRQVLKQRNIAPALGPGEGSRDGRVGREVAGEEYWAVELVVLLVISGNALFR